MASRNLKPGDILFREKAVVNGPKQGTLPVCLSCYTRIEKISDPFRCTGCGFPFCSETCAQVSHRSFVLINAAGSDVDRTWIGGGSWTSWTPME